MRTFAQIVPTFWSRGSGRKLRDKPYARLLALYFMTSPASTMIGLYYVSRRTILEDVGIPETEFAGALAAVQETGIAYYDQSEELVYVPQGARYQVGATLSTGDRKRGTILGQLGLYGNHPFVLQWITRYYDAYSLGHEGLARPRNAPSDAPSLAPSDGTATGAVTAPFSVPVLISGSRDQEQGSFAPDDTPLVADLQTRAQLWVRDANLAQLKYPQPEKWREMTELNQLVAEVFGGETDVLRNDGDLRVRTVLARWAEGHPQARLRQAIRGAKHSDLIAAKPDLQNLATILKDSVAVDKYCRLAKTKDPASSATLGKPRPPRRDADEEALAARKREQNLKALESASPQELQDAETRAKAITGMAGNLFRRS